MYGEIITAWAAEAPAAWTAVFHSFPKQKTGPSAKKPKITTKTNHTINKAINKENKEKKKKERIRTKK